MKQIAGIKAVRNDERHANGGALAHSWPYLEGSVKDKPIGDVLDGKMKIERNRDM